MNIDTHCHLGGSIPPHFIWDVVLKHNLTYLAESFDEVYSQMVFVDNEQHGFHRFLDKFRILDQIRWTEDLIDESIKMVCDIIKKENTYYTFMDFSINKYMMIGWHKYEAVKFIYDCFERYLPGKVGLILSIKYEATIASQRQYAKLIENPDLIKCLVGIDIVGDESKYDWLYLKSILIPWKKANKLVRAHVGEFGGEDNIRTAIKELGVTNIAHGIKITDENLIKEAIDNEICFDLGLTSNYLTGVVNGTHPIVKMFNDGLKLTLGSDDPVTCNTSLSKEYELALRLGMSQLDCNSMRANAVALMNRYSH